MLQEYLQKTKENRIQHQVNRKEQIEQKQREKRRNEFEKSCMIDRASFFEATCYVVNHYEKNDMKALIEYQEKRRREGQDEVVELFQTVAISSESESESFSASVGKAIQPLDSYELQRVNPRTKTLVNFFEFKRQCLNAYHDSLFFKRFLDNVEERFHEKRTLNIEDVHLSLVDISNDRKIYVRK